MGLGRPAEQARPMMLSLMPPAVRMTARSRPRLSRCGRPFSCRRRCLGDDRETAGRPLPQASRRGFPPAAPTGRVAARTGCPGDWSIGCRIFAGLRGPARIGWRPGRAPTADSTAPLSPRHLRQCPARLRLPAHRDPRPSRLQRPRRGLIHRPRHHHRPPARRQRQTPSPARLPAHLRWRFRDRPITIATKALLAAVLDVEDDQRCGDDLFDPHGLRLTFRSARKLISSSELLRSPC
jgi:hypothetical protein